MSSAAKAEPEVAVSEQTPNPNQTESLDNAKSKVDAHDVNTYCPGLKIEAKDFDGKWYPAKITDIDWTENEILVHFENWSTKFDEWIQMDSSRLRHLPKDPPAPVTFAKGEEVMAQWNANQKYPGTIQAVRSNGRYDVLFHDGFLKSGLPGIKIAKIDSENIRNDIKNFTDIGTKEERRERKRKINVAELFHINKRSKKKGLVHSKSPDVKTYPVNRSRIKKTLPATGETEVIDADMETAPSEPTTPQQPEAKPNATTTPVSTSKNLVETSPLSVEVKYHDGRTETWSKQLYQRSEGRTAGKFDIIIMNPQGKKFRSRNEIMKYCEENGIVYTHEAFDFSAKGRPKSKPIVQTTLVNSEPVQTEAMEKPPPPKKPRRKSQQEESIPVIPALPQPPAYLPQLLPVESPALDEGKIFIGDIEVKTDNGKLICPVKECSKHFRRENLLHMHMKHYHPEFSKFLDYTPSVTDLAYARTVGNMEPIEGPQQASRKSFTVEKTEKTPTKIENSRRTIGSVSEIKEVKKAAAKLTETKIDAKLNVNIAPVASTSTVEEVPDLNISSPAIEAFEAYENTLQTTPTAQAAQDNRLPTVEESQFEQVQEVAEQPLPLPNETKTLKHSTHRRRKPARFQGSFSDQIRRRKYNMHDNRRSNYKIGKKEPQTPVPQTSVPSPLAMEDLSNSNTSSQAFSMARYPKQQSIVSNEISDYTQGTEDSKSPLAVDNEKVEKLRRNEIINCVCGVTEEDGLMIQCDLCLCWQHGHCSSILIDSDVPDKYICSICKNPFRGRPSMKYIHDQEWLKEGTLPSLSFRSKREEIINSRKAVLKRSHDLSGSISLLSQVIHSLRVKLNIAEKKDHPKLWLWAKKWSEKKPSRLKENDIEIKEEKLGEANGDIKLEGSLVHKEQLIPKAPEPEAPIDSAECRLNLLDHLIHYQTLVDARLSCIESLVAELESMQEDAVDDETPEEYPRTKATVRMLLRDLNTMKKIAAIS